MLKDRITLKQFRQTHSHQQHHDAKTKRNPQHVWDGAQKANIGSRCH
ncbi:Uncharacterised protein [Vibrio cholerae]|nr:Uncharacterised protein [Vibrio cholerae]